MWETVCHFISARALSCFMFYPEQILSNCLIKEGKILSFIWKRIYDRTVAWAEKNNLRWAFTLSNAGTYYFEDR